MDLLIAFIAGIVASFVGVIAGGGGLISVAALLFLGVPLDVTIATNRLASISATSSAVIKYNSAGKVDWLIGLRLGLIGIIGAGIGALILVNIDVVNAEKLVSIVLLALIPVVLLNKDVGLIDQPASNNKQITGYVLYFIMSILGGLFGSGLGTVTVIIIATAFGKKFTNAVATNWVAWFFVSITSSIIFIINGLVDYKYAAALAVGMILGGYLGAATAIKKGDAFVKFVIITMQIIVATKLLFF
ncbi:sulfite exporter TauE/SafE family protein [Candidatus Saccharibacteria bacterium]|jgi:uncharacterized membrane protein YfcA|nr:sulfite exporter TauE/SafE family protein [Candidatus Saccharibacteria bacterium]